MSRSACERAPLVEALFDGRLGPAERGSTTRHLQSCAACAELAHDLTAIQALLRAAPGSITQLEHQRARLALLGRTAAPSSSKRRPGALLVAALLLMPVAVWAAVSSVLQLAAPDAAHEPTAPARKPVRREAVAATDTEQAAPPASEAAASAPPTPDSSPLPAAAPAQPRRARPISSVQTAAAGASRDFAAAMQALARGDFSASAGMLHSFAAAHPDDPRVEDAMYLEAIALERAGQLAGAVRAARRYLDAYPRGAHLAQARRIAGD